MRLSGIILLLVCALSVHFYRCRRWKLDVFFLFMNNIINDLPLKMIHASLIHVTKWNTIMYSVLICLKNGKFATSFFEVFNSNFNILNTLSQFFSENSHALLENIVQIYSKIFLIRNSSF